MKPLRLPLLAALVVGCHVDKLFSGDPSGGHGPPAGSVATRLIFTTEPATATAGAPLPLVRVTAADAAGRAVAGFGGDITVALAPNPSGGTLSGTQSVTATNGVATFSDLRIERAASGYVLTATASDVEGTTSTSFMVNPGPATALVFTTQPNNALPGAKIQPPVQVMVLDAFGNFTSFAGFVRVAIGNNGGLLAPGKLSGTNRVPAVNGVATFSDLSIDQAGNGYTLTAAFDATAVLAESNRFNIGVL